MSSKIINLEAGMPSAESAMTKLSAELRSAKAGGFAYAKIIHGYGSSGKGGAIKSAARQKLREFKRSGRIRDFVPGEEFSPFSADARRIADLCPEVARDRDFSLANPGITVVLL